MPYISKEEVANIRKELKTTFPEYKFSVRWDRPSSINVAILSGPVEIINESGYERINPYHYENHYSEYPEVLAFLKELLPIVRRNVVTEHVCSDYGNIPTYYTNISFGKWDKSYKVTK